MIQMIPAINRRPPNPPKKYPRLVLTQFKPKGVTFFGHDEWVEETIYFYHLFGAAAGPDYYQVPDSVDSRDVAMLHRPIFCAIPSLRYL
jgi:hypothetical protein